MSTRIQWNVPTERTFEAGVDRGVLYLNDGTAVAWNGLTSVQENGVDSASEFYMDGRPFLYLPRVKEFLATLNAYTYPTEFASVMGVAEIADGMYIDSQMSDSFGLSYRTKVGDAISSLDAGYKIHVIYNATVAPQDSQYESLSDSINPTEFSWNIQAVPVPVSGYNPTAHIVLDTRHLDPDKLSSIELLLYGDDLTAPMFPDPQTLFDLLSYGDSIIITDNGDGTWTAEGSYSNVKTFNDGTFQINNANAIGHGDGTYDISSTP